jgi:NSS family neurotransmitter:Na+ symporter
MKNNNQPAKRDSFASSFGVLVAMAGSAVGLGNLWRFPYLVGENGGAAFILIYLGFVILAGMPVMLAEFIIGRRGQASARGAFQKLAPGTHWGIVGVLGVICCLCILSFYSVVGGWCTEYLFKSVCFDFTEGDPENLKTLFSSFSSSVWLPILCHTIFLALTAGVVVAGIQNGIEKFSKVMMPLLFLIIIGIAIRSMTLPGSGSGLRFLFEPNWSKVTSQTFLAALGQAFFSLSLGSCMVVTYASYVKKDANIISLSTQTAVADTLFAIIAGCAIMPAVFAFGISPGEGPDLVFVTLPHIFSQMPLGGVIAIFFFVALLLAALTSSISMLEVIVAFCIEQFKMKRKAAVIVGFVFIWILGCLCSLSMGPLSNWKILGKTIFDLFDFISADFLMLIGGLLIVLFAGWKLGKATVFDEITNGGTHPVPAWLLKTILFLIRFVAPAALLAIAIFQIHE